MNRSGIGNTESTFCVHRVHFCVHWEYTDWARHKAVTLTQKLKECWRYFFLFFSLLNAVLELSKPLFTSWAAATMVSELNWHWRTSTISWTIHTEWLFHLVIFYCPWCPIHDNIRRSERRKTPSSFQGLWIQDKRILQQLYNRLFSIVSLWMTKINWNKLNIGLWLVNRILKTFLPWPEKGDKF